MKNLKFLIIALLIIGCKEKEAPLGENQFRLNGKVTGMDSGKLYAISYEEGKELVDTLTVEAGEFLYKGEIHEPVKSIYISTQPEVMSADDPVVNFYLEPSTMTANIDVNDIKESSLRGSKAMEDYYELEKRRNKITNRYEKELQAFNQNREKFNEATSDEEKKELKWKDDDLRNDLEPYYDQMKDVTKTFIENNPNSYISYSNFPWVLKEYNQKEAQAIYDRFPSKFKTGETAERIEKDIEDMAKGIPGAKAPDFKTVDINGEPIEMADFRGKYLLIDFWASWCVPCRKGNPHLLNLYAKYKPKGFEILGVSDDDNNPDAWRKAVKEDEIGVWRHVLRGMKVDRSNGGFKLLDDGISRGYNISTLPTKILINPNGVVVGRYGGGGATDEELDRDLAAIFEK